MTMPHAEEQDDFNPYGMANEYRKAGWLGTIPLPYNEKHPPPKYYTGAAAEYPSDEKVAEWLGRGRSNIGLRLAETDFKPEASPYDAEVYELIGIDVDDYASKTGADQLRQLESELGALPPTVVSSSRWDVSEDSGIRVFLVPTGYHFLGKAASCIEVIQKAHRYMVTWPSVNPDVDAPNPTYRFRAPDGAFYDVSDEPGSRAGLAGIPPLADVAVLPEAWLDFLAAIGCPPQLQRSAI